MAGTAGVHTNRELTGSVLFAIPGPTDLWGWQPKAGLVKIRSPFRTPRASFDFDLSSDGDLLFYTCVLALPGSPRARFALDLLSGREEEIEPLPPSTEPFYGQRGQECRVEYIDWVDFRPRRSTLHVCRDEFGLPQPPLESKRVEFAFDDIPGSVREGRPVQFSPDGQRIAVSFDHGVGHPGSLTVVELANGSMTRRDGFVPSGSSAWSPDSRYLVGERRQPFESRGSRLAVCNLDTGETTALQLDPSLDGAAVRGWSDPRHVLISTRRQRLITFHALDIESGRTVERLSFRLPLPAGSAAPWLWAPRAVVGHPEEFLPR